MVRSGAELPADHVYYLISSDFIYFAITARQQAAGAAVPNAFAVCW
jgi:hypothetical protein